MQNRASHQRCVCGRFLHQALVSSALVWSLPALAQERAPAADAQAAAGTDERRPKERKQERSDVSLGGRVYTRAIWRDATVSPDLLVDSARVRIQYKRGRTSAELELELADVDEEGELAPAPRDVWLAFKAHRSLHFKAGQFKKPFSRLQLLSRRELPLIERGLYSTELVERTQFGDRDLGAQVVGKVGRGVSAKLTLGAFTGVGLNKAPSEAEARDLAARFELNVHDDISFGASMSRHRISAESDAVTGTGYTLDSELLFGPLRVVLETGAGQDPRRFGLPVQAGATGFVSYRRQLGSKWALEPVVAGEVVVPDLSRSIRMWRAVLGANVPYGETWRFMLQGERRGSPDSSDTRVVAQAALDF